MASLFRNKLPLDALCGTETEYHILGLFLVQELKQLLQLSVGSKVGTVVTPYH